MSIVYPFVIDVLRGYLTPHSECLEIGCGAMQYRPFLEGRYRGLDLPTSPYLVDPPDYVASAETIPCRGEAFDVVFGVGSFYLMPNPVLALAECHRILRPDGLLVVFDYQKPIGLKLRSDQRNSSHAWDFLELRDLIIEAGFAQDAVRDLSATVDTAYPVSAWGALQLKVRNWLGVSKLNHSWLIVEARKNAA